MAASKATQLEKRVEKLERELAAYKRQLKQRAPGANGATRDLNLQLVAMRQAIHHFFDLAEAHDVRWNVHPDLSTAYQRLMSLALAALKAEAAGALTDAKQTEGDPIDGSKEET